MGRAGGSGAPLMADTQPTRQRRLRLFHALIALAGAGLLGSVAWWLVEHAGAIVTSDARVRARMVAISSDVAGRILQLEVDAGEPVKAGQVIARLDDQEARLALAAATLELKSLEAQVERQKLRADVARGRSASRIDGRRSGLAAASADIAATRVLLEAAEASHARTRQLHAAKLVTEAAMERATAELEAARQAAQRAEAALAEGRAGVGEVEAEAGEAGVIDRNITALALAAHALRQRIGLQKVELEQHTIASPLTGVIDEVFADAGEHIAPGARIALAHDPRAMWIEANIKETDLARVRAGAEVEIRLDAATTACRGRVERIGAAATSEFALIPNANPTGVFTKITQRVPVRIGLGAGCSQVRPSAMATLKIRAP